MQRRHDPRKNDLRASGFAELSLGPARSFNLKDYQLLDISIIIVLVEENISI